MTLIIFLYATILGSFVNVLIYRLPKELSIISPPSACTSCGKRLTVPELIPVISFLLQRGKCKSCNAHISLRYPLVELLSGALVTMLYLRYSLSLTFFANAAVTLILIAISFIDYDEMIIPDSLNACILAVAAVYAYVNYAAAGTAEIGSMLFGLLFGAGLFFVIAYTTGGMGYGDVKLMAVLGLYLGFWNVVVTTFFSFIFGAVISVILLALKIKERKDAVPFGPFICIAAYVAMLYGNNIIAAYVKFILSN